MIRPSDVTSLGVTLRTVFYPFNIWMISQVARIFALLSRSYCTIFKLPVRHAVCNGVPWSGLCLFTSVSLFIRRSSMMAGCMRQTAM